MSLTINPTRNVGPGFLAYVPIFPHFMYFKDTHPHYAHIRAVMVDADEDQDSLRAINRDLIDHHGPVGTEFVHYISLINSCTRSNADKTVILQYGASDVEIRLTLNSVTDYLDVLRILLLEGKPCSDEIL